ncbi:uncharacterized protein G2W53_016509 [Senna tora]|uniref:Uncharacterized protein n=1 Tax=Senna tora TaxID=362788 RepID=A0A834TNZ2_9FABA|nr:uncharacterized protein G2W53_016509 [Senna tora]
MGAKVALLVRSENREAKGLD